MHLPYPTFIFFSLFILFTCTSRTERKDQTNSEIIRVKPADIDSDLISEYMTIVETILSSDTSQIRFLNDYGKQTAYLVPYLLANKIKINNEEPHGISEISWKQLSASWGASAADSIFAMKQISINDTLYLFKSICSNYYGMYEHDIDETMLQLLSTYNFYTPILSADKKRSVVYMDFKCGGLCGNGWKYYLEKIDGVWVILSDELTWIA